jgi:type VI secretion system protein ImpI
VTRAGEAALTLEVVGRLPDSAAGTERRKVFGPAGGTIGRASTNHWVLGDDYVSNRHARLTSDGGAFFIEDMSTNGVLVNDRRLEKGRLHPLTTGDRVFIDPFEIVATVALPQPAILKPDVVDHRYVGDMPQPSSPFAIGSEVIPDPTAGEEEEWLVKLLGPASPEALDAAKRSAPVPSRDLLKEHHQAAPLVPASPRPAPQPLIPFDYNPIPPVVETDLNPPPSQRPTLERRTGRDRRAVSKRGDESAPGAGVALAGGDRKGASDLAAVLAGAGLEGVPVTPELAAQFGQILRVVVAGLLDVLQAREQSKRELRIAHTVIQPTRNNPLKHSVDVDDALHNLLHKHNPAYLGPVAAFEDAFNDLRNHHVAMLSSVRLAFEAMFRHFEPERLQREFDRHTPRARKGPLSALQSKPDYWEFYREWVRRMADDNESSFKTLFWVDFAKAYEEQLDRLKVSSPRGRRRIKEEPHKGEPE